MADYLREERCVGLMNANIGKYFGYLGVSETTKREFDRKATPMKELGAFKSQWFHCVAIRLYNALQELNLQSLVGNPNAEQMNQEIEWYLCCLGLSEEAKTELACNANTMKGLGAFNSQWFRQIIQSLYSIVGAILYCQVANPVAVHFDLNETPPPPPPPAVTHHFHLIEPTIPPPVLSAAVAVEDGDADGGGDSSSCSSILVLT